MQQNGDEDFSAYVRQLEIRCWQAVLRDILNLEKEGIAWGGKLLRPRLLCVIGDHPQLQSMCSIASSSMAAAPCRVCHVPCANLNEFYSLAQQESTGVCRPRLAKDTAGWINGVAERWRLDQSNAECRELVKPESIVMPPQLPAFLNAASDLAQFSDEDGGVHAHSPQDRLHHGKSGRRRSMCFKSIGRLQPRLGVAE